LHPQRYAVLDGGFSTTLEASGYMLDKSLWSAYAVVDNPDGVTAVHRQFLEAGADIVTTCSYQMSYEGFASKGIDATAAENLFRKGTALARTAVEGCGRPGLVAASVATYGAHLGDGSEYSGRFGKSIQELIDWHRPKFEVLSRSRADILACETVPCVEEVKAFQHLLMNDTSGRYKGSSWISVACKSSHELNSGQSLEDAIRAIEDPIDATVDGERVAKRIGFGINCTSPAFVNDLVITIAENCCKSRVVVAYPNSGERWDGVTREWCPAEGMDNNGEFGGDAVTTWYDSGATVIGGCCRSTPATIGGIRRSLRSRVSVSG
ncbi:unnamed protein product, partial [Ectocarpus fasciculatus]